MKDQFLNNERMLGKRLFVLMPALIDAFHLGLFPFDRANLCAGSEVPSDIIWPLVALFLFPAYSVEFDTIILFFHNRFLVSVSDVVPFIIIVIP